MSKRFPRIKFGICPVCGGGGGDDPDAGGADVPATDTTGNGHVLEYYQGDLMCSLCKKKRQADEESLIMAEKHRDEEEFRAKAGFERSVS